MIRHRLVLLLIGAVLALGVAACGGGDDDGGDGGGGDTAQQPAQTDPGAGAGTETEGDAGEQGESPAQVVASADPQAGETVFEQNCATCHGDQGGGGTGPALAGNQAAANPGPVLEQIREGGGGMPPFQDQLSDRAIADVAAYVVEDLAQR